MQHHNVLVPAQDDSSDEILSSQDAIESVINRYVTLLKNKSAIGENVLFKQSCQFKDSHH